ncbi:MAG: hypothetical protein FWD05_04495 [Oscillospiraceae bacterium]|nr:hypothetical protein [Oscillospiraceae bacterium]
MQGYSGAPARQYLRTCEETMGAANTVVSSSVGSLPAIARPPVRRLPHLEADAVFSPGVTAGFSRVPIQLPPLVITTLPQVIL